MLYTHINIEIINYSKNIYKTFELYIIFSFVFFLYWRKTGSLHLNFANFFNRTLADKVVITEISVE